MIKARAAAGNAAGAHARGRGGRQVSDLTNKLHLAATELLMCLLFDLPNRTTRISGAAISAFRHGQPRQWTLKWEPVAEDGSQTVRLVIEEGGK